MLFKKLLLVLALLFVTHVESLVFLPAIVKKALVLNRNNPNEVTFIENFSEFYQYVKLLKDLDKIIDMTISGYNINFPSILSNHLNKDENLSEVPVPAIENGFEGGTIEEYVKYKTSGKENPQVLELLDFLRTSGSYAK